MAIAFDTWHTVVNVYVEDKHLYSWGETYHQKGQMLGAMRHVVSLPEKFSGKNLKIELLATEENPMPNLLSVALYKVGDSGSIWFNRPILLLIIGSFLMLFGIIIHFIAGLFASRNYRFFETLMIGLVISLTGIYILCRGNFLQLIISSPQIYNAIEYVSLFATPLPMLLYLYRDAVECKKRFVTVVYYACIAANILFVIGAIVLNFTTKIHLCMLLQVYYGLALLVIVTLFLILGLCYGSGDIQRKRIFGWGIFSFLIGAIISIAAFALCYNPFWAELLDLWKWYNYILPTALCILVVLFVTAFYIDMKLILEKSYRSELLNYMVYFDALTNSYNRRSFEEDMELLNQGKISNLYGIISIDLNGLKFVNDTIGHNTGDSMLKSVARLLQNVCPEGIKSYRLGGDEFAVIMHDKGKEDCVELIDNLQLAIQIFNKNDNGYILSVACGQATSEEAETAELVFELADRRMYGNKQEMKK